MHVNQVHSSSFVGEEKKRKGGRIWWEDCRTPLNKEKEYGFCWMAKKPLGIMRKFPNVNE